MMNLSRREFLQALGIQAAALTVAKVTSATPPLEAKPNIIVIMCDDMGFSDIGCYGGEIETPNIDRLAQDGLRFTQFYNTARCCPTRASLLTGLYSHQASIGHMTGDYGVTGYRGRLNRQCVTIGEALRPAGYRTFVTGKWHVGAKQRDWWPLQRGFDRFYGVPQGGGFYFKPKQGRSVVLDSEEVHTPESGPMPPGWYSTDAWTDHGLEFVEEAVQRKQPFFWYLAHNAPHWPLQALDSDIAKYKGRYLKGWDAVRAERHARMIEMGIVDKSWPLTPRDEKAEAWTELDEATKEKMDTKMAIYAAQIDRVDRNVGRLVARLKQLGIFDNTLILFLADNGGCAEGGIWGFDREKGRLGTADSFSSYGLSWANASNTLLRRRRRDLSPDVSRQHDHAAGGQEPAAPAARRKAEGPGGDFLGTRRQPRRAPGPVEARLEAPRPLGAVRSRGRPHGAKRPGLRTPGRGRRCTISRPTARS